MFVPRSELEPHPDQHAHDLRVPRRRRIVHSCAPKRVRLPHVGTRVLQRLQDVPVAVGRRHVRRALPVSAREEVPRSSGLRAGQTKRLQATGTAPRQVFRPPPARREFLDADLRHLRICSRVVETLRSACLDHGLLDCQQCLSAAPQATGEGQGLASKGHTLSQCHVHISLKAMPLSPLCKDEQVFFRRSTPIPQPC